MRHLSLSLLIALLLPVGAGAYEPATHEQISINAVNNSVLNGTGVMSDLGLEREIIDDRVQSFPDSKGTKRSVRDLISTGSNFEDTLSDTRALRHFFNPRTGRGLVIPILGEQMNSPDWTLARSGAVSAQEFSYWNARQNLFDALIKSSEADRKQAFGRTFQTLGHVIHHLQDMAQPQHVRNDMHCDSFLCFGANFVTLGLAGFYSPSGYEKYTDKGEVRQTLPFSPSSVGYDVLGSAFTSAFNAPRKFWNTEEGNPDTGKGIAEFTHRNFVSQGSNFRSNSGGFTVAPGFPSPDPSGAEIESVPVQQLPGVPPFLDGNVLFVKTPVTDSFLGGPVLDQSGNPAKVRASTFSIFDADLQRVNPTATFGRFFTLNRFNYGDMHKHLIPRAVAHSAGMINYFFRGKLDFKKDEQDPTKFRIVNLGPEAMNGRFKLYYDAVDGNRYPVTVDPADVNRDPDDSTAWRLTITALNPAVPNSNLSAPVSFTAPANDGSPQSPKVVNEYMLVFNGNMGEEREDKTNGVLGAVASKSITTPYNSALYLLGVDAAGQRVALRADKTGTRVVPANEFHPLRGITIPAPYQTLTKSYVTKQTAFTQHTFGYSYETLTATVGIHYPFYGAFATGWVKNSATGAFDVVGGVVWTAKSPDPLIGEFRFRPIVPESNPAAATLEYRRSYQDASGNPQTFTGSIPLPPTPGNKQNYLVFPNGVTFVSGDGLAVSGFEKNLQVTGNPSSVTQEDYDLRVTLAEVPTLAFVKTGQRVVFSSNTTSRPQTTQVTGTVTTTVPCDPPPPTILTGNVTTTDYLDDRIMNIDERHFIDYFNGALRSYRRVENSRALISYLSTGVTMGGGRACSWVYSQTKGEAIDKLEVDGGIVFGNGGTLVDSARSDQSGFPRPLLGAFNRSWEYRYEGLSPAPPVQYTPIPAPISTNTHSLMQAISDRVEDAVYSLQTTSGPAVVRFRIHDITNMWYVADSSPIGEVFFATADLSVVDHEPKRGPKVVIPPNVVRLLAAVWL